MVFFGLRGFVFTDCINYFGLYQNDVINSFDYYSGIFSPIFLFEIILFKSIGASYWLWVFVRELFLSSMLFKIIKLNNIRFIYFLLAFLAYRGTILEFNLYQNSVSIYLIYYLLSKNSKIKVYNLLGFIVALFYHFSAAILAPFLFLTRIAISKLVLIGLTGTALLFSLYTKSALMAGIATLTGLMPLNLDVALEILLINSGNYISIIGLFERSIILILIVLFSSKKDNFILFIVIWYMIYSYFSFSEIIVDRIGLLFIPALWIVLARTMQRAEKSRVNIILILVCIAKLYVSVSNEGSEYRNIIFTNETFEEAKNRTYNYLGK